MVLLPLIKRSLRAARRVFIWLLAASAALLAGAWLFYLDEDSSIYGRLDFVRWDATLSFDSSPFSFRVGSIPDSDFPGHLWTTIEHGPDQVDTIMIELQRWVPGKGPSRSWNFPGRFGGTSVFSPQQGKLRTWIKCQAGFDVWYLQKPETPELLFKQVRVNIPCWFAVLVLAAYPTLVFYRGPVRSWRRRRRGQCPKCGYSLTQLIESRCPECGAAFNAGFENE